MSVLTQPFTIRPIEQVPQWDQFASAHPCGSVFHTSAMVRAQASSIDQDPIAIAAVLPDNSVAGMLVAAKITLHGAWPSNLSSRSVFFAQPLATHGITGERAIQCLLNEHDRLMHHQVVFAEIRPMCVGDPLSDAYINAGFEPIDYSNYEMNLNQAPDEIFRRMSPKRRNNIRANQRRGLTVRSACPQKEIATFYDHLTQSHCRSRVPLVDIGFFERLFDELPTDQFRMTIAQYEGKPIASACHFLFNGRVHWTYAGTYRIKGIAAQASLVWETIQWAIEHGFHTYDFAGAGWSDETYGPGIFKGRFGGDHVNVHRYRKVYSKWRMKIAETGYRMTRPILSV